ncbi:hypothetical protein EVAR_39647_1 [Eumeta japonica]|uniref:Uncharacterized protein n=1 Tax=Eumeta variegata TaxID=151549 RepID=A0A4C1WI82_EUMVA|nr:hypothetical protein EVAR_39647_1 [Eumeta japonica]
MYIVPSEKIDQEPALQKKIAVTHNFACTVSRIDSSNRIRIVFRIRKLTDERGFMRDVMQTCLRAHRRKHVCGSENKTVPLYDCGPERLDTWDEKSEDGRHQDWLSFINKFESLVSKYIRGLNSLQVKDLHICCSCLSAEPRALVQYLNIGDDSYLTARDSLQCRYQNTRRLETRSISEILNLPNVAGVRSRLLMDFLDPLSMATTESLEVGTSVGEWSYILCDG